MENYTSDSSDNDSGNKALDYTHASMDTVTLELTLDEFANDEKKPASEIESLHLHHNLLSAVPENISMFTQLKILDLSWNGLTTLPDIFAHCPLSSLIVKNNQIRSGFLPKTFTVCTTLKELNLSGNALESFPEQIFSFPGLKYLYLGANRISNIPKDIYKINSLQILSMGGNELTEVPATLGQLKSLQALVLSDNRLESLPANIAQLRNLKSLLLHKNRLRTLPPEIVTLKNLTELSLRENPLVVQFVSDMTYNPTSLVELSARVIKEQDIPVEPGDVPIALMHYLKSGHRCVNPKCKGVYFDSRVEHIKFVDFCGKYRIPLLQYLCSSKCASTKESTAASRYMLQKVLLG